MKTFSFLTFLLLACFWASCSSDPNQNDADLDGDRDGDSLVIEEHPLDASHEGFAQAECWSAGCHDKATTHYPEMDPYQCTLCHGINGAQPSPESQTPCSTCHLPVHGEEGFPDPESCIVCHEID